jgi:myo-inositol-1-phosphate synthase
MTANQPLLILIAGAKGAIGSTIAAAICLMQDKPDMVLPSLTTSDEFDFLGPCPAFFMGGWDRDKRGLHETIISHRVLPNDIWQPAANLIHQISIKDVPPKDLSFEDQVKYLVQDIEVYKEAHSECLPVFVNLLPAGVQMCHPLHTVPDVYRLIDPGVFPDLPYVLAAIRAGIPVVNFTPNCIEVPAVVNEALARNIPLCGRDGKTGQTYLKVVLASALKARNLMVDGWYSLNILGNADGKNLMDPERAAGKVSNKTNLLDDILGYRVGANYETPSHKVHIDYYPPRGDAKEAWDVIDFKGLFGLPMGLRLNFQGRDSILAAPMVMDLARWMVVLQQVGRAGLIPELGFFFKVPVGDQPPISFQEQVSALQSLKEDCHRVLRNGN